LTRSRRNGRRTWLSIVGTAFVRLRVIGDKLKGDITDATKKAVNDAAPDLKRSGEDAGEHLGEGIGSGVERAAASEMARIGDEIGNALGTAMGNSLGRSLRNRISGAVRNGIAGGRTELNRAQDFFKPVSDKFEKFFGDKSKQFEGLFSKALISGISLAVIALPSALAFLGAGIGAVAATAVTALSSLGPAAAGAALTAIAAFSAIKISAGLIGLALKQQTPQLLGLPGPAGQVQDQRRHAHPGGAAVGVQRLDADPPAGGPGLQPELTDLGIVVGNVAIHFADAVRQGVMMDRIRLILATNNAFIARAGAGVSSLAQAFIVLLSHLSPITDFLGSLIQDMGQWVLQTLLAAEASGQLDAFITRMFDSLRYFVGILVDFGVGIWNIFQRRLRRQRRDADQPARRGGQLPRLDGGHREPGPDDRLLREDADDHRAADRSLRAARGGGRPGTGEDERR
jgi:hypothetical protein